MEDGAGHEIARALVSKLAAGLAMTTSGKRGLAHAERILLGSMRANCPTTPPRPS
jgi:hypothetical protein